MEAIERRKFLGLGRLSPAATMALGTTQAGRLGGKAIGSIRQIDLAIGDALVEMVDLQRVYIWTFGDPDGPRLPDPCS